MLYVYIILFCIAGVAIATYVYIANLEPKQPENDTGTDDPHLAKATRRRYDWGRNVEDE